MGTFVGVDVGTGSVRAALFAADGRLLASSTQEIAMWSPRPDFYQQDSEAVWQACCLCVRRVLAGREKDGGPVLGIGFDATCSLVVLDKQLNPLTISPNGEPNQNIIVWMDHRAVLEAEYINSLHHPALATVGGTISPEMQTPKLLWLKRNLSKTYSQAGAFMDLPDFLTWKATGDLQRSLCTLVCKWTYMADPAAAGWSADYFQQIGLDELADEGWTRIGTAVAAPGAPVGAGLSAAAAEQLGLPAGTPVATSLIDAHAGGLGLMACRDDVTDPCTRLGIIAGTSSCLMAVSETPLPVPGVWGPYWSAMLPGLWLSEGGQSASGALLQHVLDTHPAAGGLDRGDGSIQSQLEARLTSLAEQQRLSDVALLASDLHVYPDHHGNRSPHADPSLRGMVSGLSLDAGLDSLARLYLATVQAVCYGSRSILEALKSAGHRTHSVYLCGGVANSPLFVQTLADVIGVPVTCPDQPEAVLLGAAMLAAVAAGRPLDEVRRAMGGPGRRVSPRTKLGRFHTAKYAVFRRMYEDQLAYRALMSDAAV